MTHRPSTECLPCHRTEKSVSEEVTSCEEAEEVTKPKEVTEPADDTLLKSTDDDGKKRQFTMLYICNCLSYCRYI